MKPLSQGNIPEPRSRGQGYKIWDEHQNKLEGTQTHVVLLLTQTFEPQTIALVGYPKVIPYTNFAHFWAV